MNPARTKLIRQQMLEALKHCQGYALPEDTMRSHVCAMLRPPVTDDEWKTHSEWLSANGHITRVPSDLDDELVQWAITERGRVLLQTL